MSGPSQTPWRLPLAPFLPSLSQTPMAQGSLTRVHGWIWGHVNVLCSIDWLAD